MGVLAGFTRLVSGKGDEIGSDNGSLKVAIKPQDGAGVDGGYFSTSLPASPVVQNAIRLGSAIDGTRDTIVLVITPITANIDIYSALTWREIS